MGHKSKTTFLDVMQTKGQQKADPLQMAKGLMQLGEQFQRTAMEYAREMYEKSVSPPEPDPLDPVTITKAFVEAGLKIAQNPRNLLEANAAYMQGCARLWQSALTHAAHPDQALTQVVETPKGDKRFSQEAWTTNAGFDFMKQHYLLWDRWVRQVSGNIDGLDPKVAKRVGFFSQQISNAMAPTNYFWGNPEAMKESLETHGQSLIQGISNFFKDLEEGKGRLNISMVERGHFRVGENIATTPGKVVFQNELIQLIQYAPTTKDVYRIPILLVPPCINKFYIFDLRPESSFVRWLLDKGWTVFVVSWVNPQDDRLAHKTFEDYVLQGVGAALEAMVKITGEPQVNALGFCIGGNFLTAYSAYRAKDKDNPLKSTTFLATLFDFEDAGDLKIFIDEEQLSKMEQAMKNWGYFDGRVLAKTFNLLRSNDLIWSFVVNNYLMGKEPMAFDLLYWNSDYTNLPAAMYAYYLRNMFLENKLIKPGALTLGGRKIDLRDVKVPSFILSTREDHIAPWQCGYAGAKVLGGPTTFVLGGSGHVAGIFNHPSKNKYAYWTGKILQKGAQDWLDAAQSHAGSWWTAWETWLTSHGGDKIPARTPGTKAFPALADAPGTYVK
ncbi:MAG: class I poly(R)-hydroxyalkanoic acid synthase [Candidatus Puniceispirillum sp.]|nr:class I poly(R)-hydroxyalkanoic acid synthase [Candidatus Puniceispirillum sp.]